MKKLLLLAIIVLNFSSLNTFGGDKPQYTSVVTIDPQFILNESKTAKLMREELEKKRSDYQSQVSIKEKELNKKKQILEDQQAKISKEEFDKKIEEFNIEVAEVQRMVQNKRNEIDQLYTNNASKIDKAIVAIVQELAKEKNFDIVLSANQAIYIRKNLDITEEIIKRLDVQFKNQ